MVGVDNTFEQDDDAGMPWEDGWVFTTYDQLEIVDMFYWVAAGDHEVEVIEEIRGCLAEKTYASRWWIELEPKEAYSSAWRDFCNQIKYHTRFVFWAGRGDTSEYEGAGEVSVAKVLQHIGNLLQEFDFIRELPAGTLMLRARGHGKPEDSSHWGAGDLGTNPPETSTSSSRMSPAGIPLFYGADDIETTLAEVSRANNQEYFTVGQFRTTREATIIDLTDVPTVPSVFDAALGMRRGELFFLNELVAQLREPIETARSNLDYVPTQVFTEYFLRVFDVDANIRGLAWISAATTNGSRCIALNVACENCVTPQTQ